MRLNHTNLTVTDVPAAAAFLTTFFEMEGQGADERMVVLFDDQQFVLTLMRGRQSGVDYPSTFHIGFFVDSKASVDALHARLVANGHDAPTPRRNNHAYGFYVQAPGGFTVEVGA